MPCRDCALSSNTAVSQLSSKRFRMPFVHAKATASAGLDSTEASKHCNFIGDATLSSIPTSGTSSSSTSATSTVGAATVEKAASRWGWVGASGTRACGNPVGGAGPAVARVRPGLFPPLVLREHSTTGAAGGAAGLWRPQLGGPGMLPSPCCSAVKALDAGRLSSTMPGTALSSPALVSQSSITALTEVLEGESASAWAGSAMGFTAATTVVVLLPEHPILSGEIVE
mmetsp:Transcript_31800/g.69583  ORF Transcript_31800/g.69583 Transcript_31800/m.69583 type:complete len:227 (+) Transcript_31800:384-1064(+)